MGYITLSVCPYFTFSFPVFFVVVVVVSRPIVPQLAPPKIPEGERVDFDVSGRINVRSCWHRNKNCTCHYYGCNMSGRDACSEKARTGMDDVFILRKNLNMPFAHHSFHVTIQAHCLKTIKMIREVAVIVAVKQNFHWSLKTSASVMRTQLSIRFLHTLSLFWLS